MALFVREKYGNYKSIADRISAPIWHLDEYKLCQAYLIAHKLMSSMVTVAISDDTENVEPLARISPEGQGIQPPKSTLI